MLIKEGSYWILLTDSIWNGQYSRSAVQHGTMVMRCIMQNVLTHKFLLSDPTGHYCAQAFFVSAWKQAMSREYKTCKLLTL